MEMLLVVIVGVIGLIAAGLGYSYWCYNQDLNRQRAALQRVFNEYPQYVQTFNDFEIFARKYMRELNVETITYTYNLKD